MTVLTYDIAKLTESTSETFYVDPTDRWNCPSIYVRRDWSRAEDAKVADLWHFTISHSSSSSCRDTAASLEATAKMVAWLTDALDTAADMVARVEEFEAAYQARKAAMQAEYEAAAAAKKAKIEADTQLTASQVNHLIASICVDIKHGGKHRVVRRFRERGNENTQRLIANRTMGGAVQFKLSGTVYSKAKLVPVLCNFAEIMSTDDTWAA